MRRILVLAVLLALALGASAETTTVILVRHAEKAGTTGDVPLTEAGAERAKELARVLADAGIDAIYVTQYVRTLQTVEPLAAMLKLKPIQFATGATYAHDLAADIRAKHHGETVLVSSHSNTTPDIIRALGVANPPSIADWEHDALFVVTYVEAGFSPPCDGLKPVATLTVIRYGAPSRATS